MSPQKLPIVYHPSYNIAFCGLENLHPFDSKKFGRIVAALKKEGILKASQLLRPKAATEDMLRDVHTEAYLNKLNTSSLKVAQVTELAPLAMLPAFLLRRVILAPMQLHVGGTMLAAAVALERGWAINIGGGMHHAYYEDGGGWCVYSDLTLALRKLRTTTAQQIRKVMIVDLDVHQGNGHERDKLHFEDKDLYILDVYGGALWPNDTKAKQAINTAVEIGPRTADEEYLSKLKQALDKSFSEFKPQFVLYNAGTDILKGDPLGGMAVSKEAVVRRDEMVFERAQQVSAPICMVLSGGYARNSWEVVSASVANLCKRLVGQQAQNGPS